MAELTKEEQEKLDRINRANRRGLLTDQQAANMRWSLANDSFNDRIDRYKASTGNSMGKEESQLILSELCNLFDVRTDNHRLAFREVLQLLYSPPFYPIQLDLFKFDDLANFITDDDSQIICGKCIVSIMDLGGEIQLTLSLFGRDVYLSENHFFGILQFEMHYHKFKICISSDFREGNILISELPPKHELSRGHIMHFRIINCGALVNILRDNAKRSQHYFGQSAKQHMADPAVARRPEIQ